MLLDQVLPEISTYPTTYSFESYKLVYIKAIKHSDLKVHIEILIILFQRILLQDIGKLLYIETVVYCMENIEKH